MRKNKLPYLGILSILVFATSCGKPKTSFTLVELNDAVELHTDLQKSYLLDSYTNVLNYCTGVEELSKPNPVSLSWTVEGMEPTSYKVYLSEKQDLTNSTTYETNEEKIDVYNLKIKTTYYWNVEYTVNGEASISNISTFTTTSLPIRNISVDGVTNFRDIGGWDIDATHRVKQGLLYRCGRLNVSSSDTVEPTITEKGIEDLKALGMKSEIDLRKTEDNEIGSITSCVAGSFINYYSTPIVYTKPIIKENLESWISIFDYLGDESNYPIMYHCNIGTDRTGVMTYLILGLLGVNIEDIKTDYCFSNFALINQYRDVSGMTTAIGKVIENETGDTLKEKIYNYLIRVGVKETSINTMISILTEEV